MKLRRLLCQILALALCAVLLLPMAAFADGEDQGEVEEDQTGFAVIDSDDLNKLIEDYLTARNLRKDRVSIGYCYLDTGDTWYYNGDVWRYSAAMYRLPLTMIFAEKEYEGELTQDSDLKGQTLAQAEENILVYDSKDATNKLMEILGGEREARTLYRAFSEMPEDSYDPDFLDYSYFSARFTTDVIKTLYFENERFPGIIDLLKRSDNDKYFHRTLGGEYEVAQKAGVFTDRRGVQYNNDTAIIYTEHPFALTIMTQDLGTDDSLIADLAVLFKDYTLTLDEPYAAWEKARSTEPAAEPAETGETPAEPAEETVVAETPAPEKTEEEQPAPEAPAESSEENAAEKTGGKFSFLGSPYLRLGVILVALALLFILLLGQLVHLILQGKREKDED